MKKYANDDEVIFVVKGENSFHVSVCADGTGIEVRVKGPNDPSLAITPQYYNTIRVLVR